MTVSNDLDGYWRQLDVALPTFTDDEREAAVALYRELAKGDPVSTGAYARALGTDVEGAGELLGRDSIRGLTYRDEDDRVIGFGGLAIQQMGHRLQVGGRTLWTWCAWDSLFIPEILGEEAHVESRDPHSGGLVRLTVGPEGVVVREPTTTSVSFVSPDAEELKSSAANVMASFCHFVYFFETPESGEQWAAQHEGTFVVSLDEAVELARRLNARTWGAALGTGVAG